MNFSASTVVWNVCVICRYHIGSVMKRITLINILLFLVITLLVVMLPTGMYAQTDEWRKENKRGENRYEGLLGGALGDRDLELLSFIGFLEPFDGKKVELKVRFFLPSGSSALIQGRELDVRKHYLMESIPTTWHTGVWNEFGNWLTKDVLNEYKIPSSNLGVVIKYREDATTGDDCAPGFVYYSQLPDSVDSYTLYLRPNATLVNVRYTLYRISSNDKKVIREDSLPGAKTAGAPFSIKLSRMNREPKCRMHLVVRTNYEGKFGDGPPFECNFYHIPQTR